MKGILIVTLTLTLSGFAALAQNVSDLFYKAVHLQEVKGDLEAAIPLFEAVVAGSKNTTLAAKAQLRIAVCYEKLGREEAYQAYAKVLNNYAKQAEVVEAAKTRMSDLKRAGSGSAEATKGLKLTKIYTGRDYVDSISPDGKKLTLLRQPDIWIRDIASSKEVRLTEDSTYKGGTLWSPDSRWIVFSDRSRNIRIVSADGGSVKTLVAADSSSEQTGNIAPTGWTSDSRKVIFHVPLKGLYAIPAAGGEWEPICTFENPDEAKRYGEMTLSPDGRWIAYSASQDGNTDIYLMPTAGRNSIRITRNPAAEKAPRWSYDSQWLAFTSSSTENPQIWTVKISPEGLPVGTPQQVTKDAFVLGGNWTKTANIGFPTAFRTEHIYTANADGSGETQLTQFPCANHAPLWSSSGRWIAFRSDYRQRLNTFRLWLVASQGGEPRLVVDEQVLGYVWSPSAEKILFAARMAPNQSAIMVATAGGDEFREVLSMNGDIGYLTWSPDGEKIVFAGSKGSTQSRIMEAPIGGGEPRELFTADGEIGPLIWSRDGKTLIFRQVIGPLRFANAEEYIKERSSGIGIIPIQGGEPRMIVPADRKGVWISDCRLDPEGKRIAYIVFDYHQYKKDGMYSIWTLDVNGGAPRQITKGGEYILCWTADGKSIIYEQRIKDMDFNLYRVPADGGEPVRMNISGRYPGISPDGKRIAFSRRIGSGYEYWLAENFLPGQAGREK